VTDSIKKDNTKTIIIVGFLAIFSLMGLVMGLSMTTLSSANQQMSSIMESTAQKTARAYQMRDVIRLRSSAVKSLLQINDPEEREKIFNKLISSTQSYIASRDELIKL